MRRIILKEARPGMQLARAIEIPPSAKSQNPAAPAGPELDAIASGSILSIDHLLHLHELGVYDLWIDDPDLDFLNEADSPVLSTPQHRLLDALRASFQKLLALGINGPDPQKPLLKRYRIALIEIINALLRSAPAVPCFAPMTLQHEDLLRHGADVCVLATILGLHLEHYVVEQRPRLTCRQARDVVSLSMGTLFHDVGEMLMPPAQRESREEFSLAPSPGDLIEEWKQHVSQGYAAVRTFIDPSAATVVLHHHQHFDGSGFALSDARVLRQRGQNIHIFSRLAMAADMFHHALQPPGAVQQPPVKVLTRLQKSPLADWFDPVALKALSALIPAVVPGMVVTLSDRRHAIVRRVLSNGPDKRGRPEVQILRLQSGIAETEPVADISDLYADARHSHDLHILEIDGSDVSAAQCQVDLLPTAAMAAKIGRELAAAPRQL